MAKDKGQGQPEEDQRDLPWWAIFIELIGLLRTVVVRVTDGKTLRAGIYTLGAVTIAMMVFVPPEHYGGVSTAIVTMLKALGEIAGKMAFAVGGYVIAAIAITFSTVRAKAQQRRIDQQGEELSKLRSMVDSNRVSSQMTLEELLKR